LPALLCPRTFCRPCRDRRAAAAARRLAPRRRRDYGPPAL